jgi:hypothetical protein
MINEYKTVVLFLLCLCFGGELYAIALKVKDEIAGVSGLPLWVPCTFAAAILFVILTSFH